MKSYNLVVLSLVLATPAIAQGRQQSARVAAADAQKADRRMASEWKATNAYMKALDAKDHSRGGGLGFAVSLLASQRAWLAFRDAQCVIENSQFAGQLVQPAVRDQCLSRMNLARAQQLTALRWKR